jgi:hypothetical protein
MTLRLRIIPWVEHVLVHEEIVVIAIELEETHRANTLAGS